MMPDIDISKILKESKNMHVLYVEDNAEVRDQTQKMLENFFDHITIATDGQDGWEKFQQKEFDIILTDINMPNMNGLQMLEKIREKDIEIVCIIISAHDENSHFTKSIELGIDGYLLKPIEIKPFITLLYKSIKKIKLQKEQKDYKTLLEQKIEERTAALQKQLFTDDLTGVGSRYAFLQELSMCSATCTPTLFLLNIDAFTIYNELYGIEVGNEILIAFAKLLQKFADAHNYQFYRISGDEFVLYYRDASIDISRSEETINTIFSLLKTEPLYIESIDEFITIGVTIGLSFSNENPLGKADMAMKAAKRSAKRFVTYHPSMDTKADLQKTLYWRRGIESALAEERVIPFFQPIVDRNQRITKYEALMRIKLYDENNQLKIISPYEFLDIAIKTKQYDALSFRLIQTAIDLMKTKGVSLSLNINLSDIYNHDLIDMLRNEIISFNKFNAANGTPENHIILEILENDNIEHYHLLTKKLVQFKQVAAKIAIDDFGSGYSNFSHIIGISPHYLKIDASLIKDIDTNRKSYEMVKAIVQFAKSLHIKTIAEFVSSKEIFDITYALGVDEFQGYYFGKPMSIEEIEAKTVADIAL
jgi:diguanylate cyclase (GGDEF)-like protein